MAEAVPKLSCGACGKTYAWKPQFAGRTLKCVCGASIKAPAAAPAPAPAASAGTARRPAPAAAPPPPDLSGLDEFEQIVAQASYEVEEDAAPPPPKRPAIRATVADAPSPGGKPAKVLAYSRRGQIKPAVNGPHVAKFADFYLPLVLAILGIVAYFIDAFLQGIHNPAIMIGFVLMKSVINLVLVFVGLLIGVKLIDLGLGPIGPALIKIAAVALLPTAVCDIISIYMWGYSFGFSILMYGGLLALLFDMDFVEVLITTGIIWVTEMVLSMVLIAAILNASGFAAKTTQLAGAKLGGSSSSSASPSATTSPAAADDSSDEPTNPMYIGLPEQIAAEKAAKAEAQKRKEAAIAAAKARVAQEDAEIKKIIDSGEPGEAREWLKPDQEFHAHRRLQLPIILSWAEQFYAAGAKMVYVTSSKDGRYYMASDFIIEMPDDPAARKAVLNLGHALHHEFMAADVGNKYLMFSVDPRD